MRWEKTEAIRRQDNSLLPASLSRHELLMIFDSDPFCAEYKYQKLYDTLIRYFRWNRKDEPEDLAQEALKRGLSRLQEGQKITAKNPESYFFGVARNLLREGWNEKPEEQLVEAPSAPTRHLFRNLNREEQVVFLTECLRDLSQFELEMLMAYTAGDGEAWARKAGLQPTTFRSRIHRLRKKLETLLIPKQS